MSKKVSKIEFHICRNEIDDCIVRMADLIKEGYTIESITNEPSFSLDDFGLSFKYSEPSTHIVLQKGDF